MQRFVKAVGPEGEILEDAAPHASIMLKSAPECCGSHMLCCAVLRCAVMCCAGYGSLKTSPRVFGMGLKSEPEA